jgi:site-specific DNA recombinase
MSDPYRRLSAPRMSTRSWHGLPMQAVGVSDGQASRASEALQAVCACEGVLVVSSLLRQAHTTRETLELGERQHEAGADLVSLSEKIKTTSAAGPVVFRLLAVLAACERDQVSARMILAL